MRVGQLVCKLEALPGVAAVETGLIVNGHGVCGVGKAEQVDVALMRPHNVAKLMVTAQVVS